MTTSTHMKTILQKRNSARMQRAMAAPPRPHERQKALSITCEVSSAVLRCLGSMEPPNEALKLSLVEPDPAPEAMNRHRISGHVELDADNVMPIAHVLVHLPPNQIINSISLSLTPTTMLEDLCSLSLLPPHFFTAHLRARINGIIANIQTAQSEYEQSSEAQQRALFSCGHLLRVVIDRIASAFLCGNWRRAQEPNGHQPRPHSPINDKVEQVKMLLEMFELTR